MRGGPGDDRLLANRGGGGILGGPGDDFINGFDGRYTVIDGRGATTATLGAGDDEVSVDGAGSSVVTGNGKDTVGIGGPNITVDTGNGADTLYLGAGHVNSGAGKDEINMMSCPFCDGSSDDLLDIDAGPGADFFLLIPTQAVPLSVDGGDGADGAWMLDQDIDVTLTMGADGMMTIPYVAPFRNVEDFFGTHGHNLVTGSDRDNRIKTFGSDDEVYGLGGDDLIESWFVDGGDGFDNCYGVTVINCEAGATKALRPPGVHDVFRPHLRASLAGADRPMLTTKGILATWISRHALR